MGATCLEQLPQQTAVTAGLVLAVAAHGEVGGVGEGREEVEDAGVMSRTVMYVNLASDPVVERLMVPDLALAVAEMRE